MTKLSGTAAPTDFAECIHGTGLVHSQKRPLANQRCVHLLLCACTLVTLSFVREVWKICERDFTVCVQYQIGSNISEILQSTGMQIMFTLKY